MEAVALGSSSDVALDDVERPEVVLLVAELPSVVVEYLAGEE